MCLTCFENNDQYKLDAYLISHCIYRYTKEWNENFYCIEIQLCYLCFLIIRMLMHLSFVSLELENHISNEYFKNIMKVNVEMSI